LNLKASNVFVRGFGEPTSNPEMQMFDEEQFCYLTDFGNPIVLDLANRNFTMTISQKMLDNMVKIWYNFAA
jgi:hypothetical protein